MITMYKIFEFDPDKIETVNEILSDDLISRQTTSVRDGKSLGVKEDVSYALVEGSEESIEKAEELFKEEEIEAPDDQEEIREAMKEEEKAAAQGMGTVFG